MANYTKAQRNEHKERVRSILARYGDTPVNRIQGALRIGKQPLTLSYKYVLALKNDINNERAKGIRNAAIDFLFAEWRDEQKQLKALLWPMASNVNNKTKDCNQIKASELINNMSADFIDKLMTSNILAQQDQDDTNIDINLTEINEYKNTEQIEDRQCELYGEVQRLADMARGREKSISQKATRSSNTRNKKVRSAKSAIQDKASID